MSTSLLTGLSGFQAGNQRLDARANNIANAQSTGPIPTTGPNQPANAGPATGGASNSGRQVYQAVSVDTQAQAGGGARTLLSPTLPSYVQQYDPESTDANDQGLVAAPNVDVAGQLIGSIADAAYSKANASVIRTADELLKQAINLKS